MSAAHIGGPRAPASVAQPVSGWVTLPSGRSLRLNRSRWDGVLDREEFEFCRSHGIPLAYDCAQSGWVTQVCTDDSPELPSIGDAVKNPAAPDPEQAAIILRTGVEVEARRMMVEVEAGRLSIDDAREHLARVEGDTVERYAAEHDAQLADLLHWAVRSAVASVLGTDDRPRAAPRARYDDDITFRPWTANDAAAYVDLLANPAVWTYMPEPYPTPFTEDTARTLIEVAGMTFLHETVAVEVDGQPIGQCLLRFDRRFAGRRASEVAYWLGERFWGNGWMSRILPLFTQRCFRRHDVDVIYAWIRSDHPASIRVAERSGFQRDRFALESQVAELRGRPGFIRYATCAAAWAASEE